MSNQINLRLVLNTFLSKLMILGMTLGGGSDFTLLSTVAPSEFPSDNPTRGETSSTFPNSTKSSMTAKNELPKQII
jgi:hypothetical protein